MSGRQYILLVLLFIVSLAGFTALEAYNRGLLVVPQQQVAMEEIVVESKPIIIAYADQKVNSEQVARERQNEQILAVAQNNEQVLDAAQAATTARLLHVPAQVDYVVQEGDNLWTIAQNILGDGAAWDEIYEQNKADIGNNPDLIFPGQHLTITNVSTGVAAL